MMDVPELAVARERLAHVRGQVAAVLAACRGPALNQRPGERQWSVGECAVHVLRANLAYLDKAEEAIRRERARGRTGRPPFRYGTFPRWFLGQMGPGARNLPAPKPFRPERRTAGPEVAEELDASLARLDDALRSAEGLDLARVKLPSPVSPLIRFPLGIALPMLVVHTERHLRQMERCMAAIAAGNAASA
ncbi:DinB family protein [bacterium]|nr:DinB family protein [bacterium]